MSNKPKEPKSFSPAFDHHRSRKQSSIASENSVHKIPNRVLQSKRAAELRERDEIIIAQAIQGGVPFDGLLLLKASALIQEFRIQEFRSPGQPLSNKGRNQRPI